jgi:tRNA(fMet)-specific endonuclease VapC
MPSASSVGSGMPGKRYLLDTNALVALLQGHQGLAALTSQAQWLGVSVINVLEFLSFDGLSFADRALFAALTARLEVVDLNHSNAALIQGITALRQTRAVKLPDAIVMVSAAMHDATVLTHDAVLLKLDAAAQGCIAQAF